MRPLTAITLGAAAVALALPASAAGRGQASPNFVVITTDDQSLHTFQRRALPNVFDEIVKPGTSFNQSIAAPPLCCPSRAGFLTGQYPHNSGVYSNRPGYPELREPASVLPAWLGSAGYRTALIGKYLTKTSKVLDGAPAPGWDRWFSSDGRTRYWGPGVNDDGIARDLRGRYVTTVLNRRAVRYLKDASHRGRPFFLWLTHNAPHASPKRRLCPDRSAEPLPRDLAAVRAQRPELPRDPSFNEADVSDKPPRIRDQRRLDARARARIRRRYRCAVAALQSVDRGVGRIVDTLRRTEELRRTVVIFTSDNGFSFGEHRLEAGKADIYEPSLRVPLVIRLPPSLRKRKTPRSVDELVAEIDLTPTILDLAGDVSSCTSPGHCRAMDGRSLAGLLTGDDVWPANRAVPIELWQPLSETDDDPKCPFGGLRTPDRAMAITFVRDPETDSCDDVGTELYDLERDPYELENVGAERPGEAQALRARLEGLVQCSGIAGRDPATPGGFCE